LLFWIGASHTKSWTARCTILTCWVAPVRPGLESAGLEAALPDQVGVCTAPEIVAPAANISPPLADNGSLLAPDERQLAAFPAGPPILIVAVDTEAEFDWSGPFLRTQTSVANIQNQRLAQEIFDRFGVRPVYLVDYAVATRPEAYVALCEIAQSGRCEIGAHLHPWITPPLSEPLNDRNSFSQNLVPSLQQEKLARLTEAIIANFAVRPVTYRAGRLGVGEEIAEILAALGYRIDMSVLPGIDLRRLHGPDFCGGFDRPYWFGGGAPLLEIPATSGFTGLFTSLLPKAFHPRLYAALSRFDKLSLRGLFAQLGLLEWTPPSPEGVAIAELRRLTRALLARGNRTFVFSYHSSTLLPGSTRYVRSPSELSGFLRRIEEFLEFFIGEVGGISMTPSQLLSAALPEMPARQPAAVLADSSAPGARTPGLVVPAAEATRAGM
jgi:hypothetical protein